MPFVALAPTTAWDALAPGIAPTGVAVERTPGAGAPGSGVPHWLQKRACGGFSAPQLGQMRGKGRPHAMQKRALAAFSV
jgi:hypothetical protein